MATLESIRTPRDLDALSAVELHGLAAQIRALLVENVSRTGGHLGPNLGVVGLTLALHCEFDSPRDRIVFDTGHQSYVHKMLTGRAGGFDRLRSRGGLSGYPARKESPHDLVENSHASTGGVDVLAEPGGTGRDVLLVSVGALAPTCLKTAQRLTEVGWAVTVVDPGWVKPVDVALVALAAEHRLVVTVEDGVRAGGFGSALAQALRDADVDVPLRDFGMPARFLSHGSREELLEESGLTAEQLAAAVEKSCRRLWGEEPLAMQAVDAVVGMGRSVHV